MTLTRDPHQIVFQEVVDQVVNGEQSGGLAAALEVHVQLDAQGWTTFVHSERVFMHFVDHLHCGSPAIVIFAISSCSHHVDVLPPRRSWSCTPLPRSCKQPCKPWHKRYKRVLNKENDINLQVPHETFVSATANLTTKVVESVMAKEVSSCSWYQRSATAAAVSSSKAMFELDVGPGMEHLSKVATTAFDASCLELV